MFESPGGQRWGQRARAEAASPALLALREPSRWMTMSALLIIRRFWLDRMLPRRSGTGSESTSGWAAVAGALLLQEDPGQALRHGLSMPGRPTRRLQADAKGRRETHPAGPTRETGAAVESIPSLRPQRLHSWQAGSTSLAGSVDSLFSGSNEREAWLPAGPLCCWWALWLGGQVEVASGLPAALGSGPAAALPHQEPKETPWKRSGWQSASPVRSPAGPQRPGAHPAPRPLRTHLESPMETGRATGWWDCRADRDRILLLALRGEAGLADTSSLLGGEHRSKGMGDLHPEVPGDPNPLHNTRPTRQH